MKRDIIIACFSDPGTGTPERKEVRQLVYGSDWKNAPYVWNFPDDGSFKGDIRSQGFESAARKLVAEAGGAERLLPYILNKIVQNSLGAVTSIGRVALVTFSAGNSAARFLMQSPSSQQLIDTFISLDSTAFQKNPQTKQPWEVANEGQGWYQYPTFGLQGLDASAMSIYLHTSIINANPDIMSTKASAELIFNELRKTKASMDAVRDVTIPSPLDFNPQYWLGHLASGPRTKYWPVGMEGPSVMDRIGNNFRIWLPTNGQNQTDGHIACCYDFQRAIFDTFLKPRWNNPEEFSCLGPECIKQFTPDPPLSGFSGPSRGMGAFTATTVVPTSKEVDMTKLGTTWELMGLPRWDLIYKGIAVAGAGALAAGVSYFFLKD